MTATPLSSVLFALTAAFGISAWLTHRLSRSRVLMDRVLDVPNSRSLHETPVPRTGGVAILVAVGAVCTVASISISLSAVWAWIAASGLLVALVSLLDDLHEVEPYYRLAAHLGAGLLLLAGGVVWGRLDLPGLVWQLPELLAYLLTLGYVVWMINLYNFMDGMDGFAGGMAVFGFGALAFLGWRADDFGFALVGVTVAAAAGGFLSGNFPPARIFLGDLGSASLGLLAAALSLLGSQRGLFPLWVAWLAFSPFIVDATWTLLRRLARGERLVQAHRSHHYQRLVLAGWSHRKTVMWSYLLMVACASTGVAAVQMGERDQWWLLAAWGAVYALIAFRVRLVERHADLNSP